MGSLDRLLGPGWNIDHISLPFGISLLSFTQIAFLAGTCRKGIGGGVSHCVVLGFIAVGLPNSNCIGERILARCREGGVRRWLVLRFASEKLGMRDFVVVLEMGDIKQVYCGSGNIHGPCLDRKSGEPRVDTQPAPSTLKLVLRHSAFLQYLLGHLRFDPMSRLRKAVTFNEPPADPAALGYFAGMTAADMDRILALFFERTAPFRKGRLVMVVDSNRVAINRGETAADPMRDHLIEQARALGAEVIDTAPVFRKHVESTGLHLEVSPHDTHWNPLATRLVADAVAATLSTR